MGGLVQHSTFISSTKYKKSDDEGYYNAEDNEKIIFYDDDDSPCNLNGIKILSPDEVIWIRINNSKSYSIISSLNPLIIDGLCINSIQVKNACRLYFEGLTM